MKDCWRVYNSSKPCPVCLCCLYNNPLFSVTEGIPSLSMTQTLRGTVYGDHFILSSPQPWREWYTWQWSFSLGQWTVSEHHSGGIEVRVQEVWLHDWVMCVCIFSPRAHMCNVALSNWFCPYVSQSVQIHWNIFQTGKFKAFGTL